MGLFKSKQIQYENGFDLYLGILFFFKLIGLMVLDYSSRTKPSGTSSSTVRTRSIRNKTLSDKTYSTFVACPAVKPAVKLISYT